MSSIVKAKHLVHTSTREFSHQNMEELHSDEHIEKVEPGTPDLHPRQSISDETRKEAEKKTKHMENEALKRSDAIIDCAMRSSREIFENAEKKGFDEGYLRGLVEGANEAYKAAEEGIQEIQDLLDFIKEERLQLIKREEKNLLAITFEIAKKIIRRAVQVEESILQDMIKEVISDNEGKIKIIVSEYQKTLDLKIDKDLAKRIKSFSKDAKVVFVKEEDLIMVETSTGVIDLSIPVQLEQLAKAVENK